MKNPQNEIGSCLKGLEIRGSVRVSLNREPLAEVNANGHEISVNISSPRYIKKISSALPHRSGKVRFLRFIASSLEKMSYMVELRDSRGEFMTMGKGIHGIMGHFKVNLIRARKYL